MSLDGLINRRARARRWCAAGANQSKQLTKSDGSVGSPLLQGEGTRGSAQVDWPTVRGGRWAPQGVTGRVTRRDVSRPARQGHRTVLTLAYMADWDKAPRQAETRPCGANRELSRARFREPRFQRVRSFFQENGHETLYGLL